MQAQRPKNAAQTFRNRNYVLMDRDGKFSPAFQAILKTEGVDAVLLTAKSPNLNAHIERFIRSIKEACLERIIFFGENSLRNAIREFRPGSILGSNPVSGCRFGI